MKYMNDTDTKIASLFKMLKAFSKAMWERNQDLVALQNMV